MSRRHEDRKSAKPSRRRPDAPGASRKKAPAKKAPSKGPSSKGPIRKAPSRQAPSRPPAGGKKTGGAKNAGPAGRRPAPRKSQRRAQGLVVTPAPAVATSKDGKVRLNQFLASCGICSRRAADELIARGRVEINGKMTTELGTRVDPESDEVRFDGKSVRPEKPVYVLFNKPKGVVCTNAAHEQKKRVIDFLPTVKGRLFTVGRLDLDSEGLILLTNDGPFALEMTHPRYGVPKLYHVVLRGRVEPSDLEKARGGVWLAEGQTTGMRVRITRTTADRTYLRVILREGKNREIRRVFAKVGFPVISLKRVRIGDLNVHGLRTGKWRFLLRGEVKDLRRIAHGDDLMTEEK